MEDIFSLDINMMDDTIIPESARDDLFKLSYLINESTNVLNQLDPWYIGESVTDPKSKFQKFKDAPGRLQNATKDVFNMYDDATDAGAELYTAEFNLVKKLMALGTRLMMFIAKLLGWIPNAIVKLLNGIMDIPFNIKKLLSGNISLYITAGDIETIYKHGVLGRLDLLIQNAELFSKGETWHTYAQRVGISIGNKIPFHKNQPVPENDKKIANKITALSRELSKMEFKPTLIQINNPDVRRLYFGYGNDGNNADMKFRGVKIRDKHKTTYLDALKLLSKSISDRQTKLQELSKIMDIKYDKSQANSNWARLPVSYQHVITNAYKGMSEVFNFIAKLTKYISSDINEYTKILNKLQKKQAKLNKNSGDEVVELPASMGESADAMNEGFWDAFKKKPAEPVQPRRTEPNEAELKIINQVIPYIDEFVKFDAIKIISGKSLSKEEDLNYLTASKYGGTPYWPEGVEWPSDISGKYTCILQINLDDIKNINNGSLWNINSNDTGLIQYFISPDSLNCWRVHHLQIKSSQEKTIPVTTFDKSNKELLKFPMFNGSILISFEKFTDIMPLSKDNERDIFSKVEDILDDLYHDSRKLNEIDPDWIIRNKIIDHLCSIPTPPRCNAINTFCPEGLHSEIIIYDRPPRDEYDDDYNPLYINPEYIDVDKQFPGMNVEWYSI